MVTPPVSAADQIATALVRSASSWNRLRMRARVEGMRVAPATPSTARAAMSISADCAYAARSDADTATGVPKPEVPSINAPKAKAMSRTNIR